LLARIAEPDPANRPILGELKALFSQVLAEAPEVPMAQYKPFTEEEENSLLKKHP